jgi:lactose/L-arabinose transport system permease protein
MTDRVVVQRGPSVLWRVKQIAAMTVLTAFCLAILLPLWWVIISSAKTPAEIYSSKQSLIPTSFTLDNYIQLLTETGFIRSIGNSLIVAVAVTVLGSLFALGAGYAFAKLTFRGRDLLFYMLVGSMVIPGIVTVLPNFILLARIGLLDTLWAIILPNLALPFSMLWMRQYIRSAVPDSVLDAARIDGSGEFRTMWSVVAPIVRPGLVGVAVWLFLTSWNNFFLPLVYLNSDENFTYPVFIAALKGNPQLQVTHLVMAAAVLSLIPVLIMYVFLQRHFVASAAMSIDKG